MEGDQTVQQTSNTFSKLDFPRVLKTSFAKWSKWIYWLADSRSSPQRRYCSVLSEESSSKVLEETFMLLVIVKWNLIEYQLIKT